jgi:hypothetical protein
MKSPSLLSRLRSAMRSGAADPVAFYGANFGGTYEPCPSGITGGVVPLGGSKRYPPARIVIVRSGEVVAETDQFVVQPNGWRFKLDLQLPITAEEILGEKIGVFAVDRRAARSKLTIDGAVQLGYIRQTFNPSETELDVDFSRGGNSKEYLLEGWSGQESEHIWTEGKESTIAITFAMPGQRYQVALLGWPFVVPDKLPCQALTISLSDTVIGTFFLGPRQHLIECDIPPNLTKAGCGTLRLGFPDAARPCDLVGGGETRMLALACKRLKLLRFRETNGDLRNGSSVHGTNTTL